MGILTIKTGPRGTQGTGPNGPYSVLFEENQPTGTVIGTVEGYNPTT
jgi:hypothetical protein